MTDDPTYTTLALGPDTWDDFVTLVEANNRPPDARLRG
jgi:hypothetical protein